MRLVKFSRGGLVGEGFLDGDDILLSGGWSEGPVEDAPFTLARLGRDALDKAFRDAHVRIPRSEAKLEAPLDPRAKIICVGINYRDHADEVVSDLPAQPALFTKERSALVGPEDALVCPRASVSYDYEGELAVVIGSPARHVAPEAALDHVGGYACFMDGSVREFQQHSLSAGKNFWRSGAFGPAIVTPDELPNIADAALVTRLNGTVVQSARTSLMLYDIATIIAYCSRWTRLEPGDVIATGTPGGIGALRKPPLWLKEGDAVEVGIEGIGLLRNDVRGEP